MSFWRSFSQVFVHNIWGIVRLWIHQLAKTWKPLMGKTSIILMCREKVNPDTQVIALTSTTHPIMAGALSDGGSLNKIVNSPALKPPNFPEPNLMVHLQDVYERMQSTEAPPWIWEVLMPLGVLFNSLLGGWCMSCDPELYHYPFLFLPNIRFVVGLKIQSWSGSILHYIQRWTVVSH